jgi:hypothetical protein
MRRAVLAALLLALGLSTALAATPAPGHRITMAQARQIARLVARHDHIDLSDTSIELDSMDLGAPFIPGYASFSVIREADTPGPDITLHRYAVNRQTGDVWEMTLCTRYSFPALIHMAQSFTGHGVSAAQIEAEGKELGCVARQSAAPAPTL